MKIWMLSDLHIRIAAARAYSSPLPGISEADVCVIAGDVCDIMSVGVEWVGEVISKHMPVVFVLGNHDCFGEDLESVFRKARRAASYYPGFHLVADSSTVIGGVRFVGGTLWTDFALFEQSDPPISAAECRRIAKAEMPDYAEIYATGAGGVRMGRLMTPKDTIGYHAATRSYIDTALATNFDGPTVVVTHHAPSIASIAPKFRSEPSSAAFASDLRGMIDERRPDVWIHGHVHHSVDYVQGETRVICNPLGHGTSPNPDFDPSLVLTV